VAERLEGPLLEAALVAAVLALVLALLVGLRLARPLHRLTDVAHRMAHGEIETRAAGSGGPRETAEPALTMDRLAAALRRQDELRRATVADIVHELRGALVGVVGRIEALQDGLVVDEKAALERMGRDARRLNRLVDDVLLLAEAQKPSLLVCKRSVDLEELTRERAAAHADRFAEPRHRLPHDHRAGARGRRSRAAGADRPQPRRPRRHRRRAAARPAGLRAPPARGAGGRRRHPRRRPGEHRPLTATVGRCPAPSSPPPAPSPPCWRPRPPPRP
jgi:two-component system sensor histidine kinase BaeS